MSALEALKRFAEQRLSAAVDDIFEYFQQTVTDYDEERERYCKLLEVLLQPQVRLRRAEVHSLTSDAEVSPQQQEVKPNLNHQAAQPPPRVKEEQEDVWGVQETPTEEDVTRSSVKIKEEEEEKPEASRLRRGQDEEPRETKTEADCGGPDGGSDASDLDGLDGGEARESFSCVFCERGFLCKLALVKHVMSHTGEKRFSCPDCGERFSHRAALRRHAALHAGERAFPARRLGRRSRVKEAVDRSCWALQDKQNQ